MLKVDASDLALTREALYRTLSLERAASGHAAALPSAASNSRRPMVTVIRPSRARCVNGTIPRRERPVFTFKEGRMPVLFASVAMSRLVQTEKKLA